MTAAVALLAGPLSGCTSNSTPTPSPSVTSLSQSPTSTSTGLRGSPVESVAAACPSAESTPGSLQPVTGEVQEYQICPVSVSDGRFYGTPVVVTPSEGAVFAALDRATTGVSIRA